MNASLFGPLPYRTVPFRVFLFCLPCFAPPPPPSTWLLVTNRTALLSSCTRSCGPGVWGLWVSCAGPDRWDRGKGVTADVFIPQPPTWSSRCIFDFSFFQFLCTLLSDVPGIKFASVRVYYYYYYFPFELLFHSRVIGACPVTTDCIMPMNYVRTATTYMNINNKHEQHQQQ